MIVSIFHSFEAEIICIFVFTVICELIKQKLCDYTKTVRFYSRDSCVNQHLHISDKMYHEQDNANSVRAFFLDCEKSFITSTINILI